MSLHCPLPYYHFYGYFSLAPVHLPHRVLQLKRWGYALRLLILCPSFINRTVCLRRLLAADADPNQVDLHGLTPFQVAHNYGQNGITQWLEFISTALPTDDDRAEPIRCPLSPFQICIDGQFLPQKQFSSNMYTGVYVSCTVSTRSQMATAYRQCARLQPTRSSP